MKTTPVRSTCSWPGRCPAFAVKFLLDHDVPDDLSYMLEQLGHEVVLLRKALPDDSSDEAVLCFLAATPPRLAQSELGNR